MNIFKSKINESQVSLEKMTIDFDNLNLEYATTKEQLVSMSEQLATFKSEFERVNTENQTLKSQVETVESESAELVQDIVAVDELASIKASEILAQVGATPIEIMTEDEMPKEESILDKIQSLTGQELNEFYKENKQEIFKLLGK